MAIRQNQLKKELLKNNYFYNGLYQIIICKYLRFKYNVFIFFMNEIIVKGYKSFKELSIKLENINLLIGANGAGKSNFLSLFEFLSNIYDQRLTQYISQSGGVNKILHQGRKVTERIEIKVSQGYNSYSLSLLESDGRLMIEHEKLFYLNSAIDIAKFKEEALLKTYNGMKRGEYIKEYISQIRKFHFHDTGKRSPFTNDCDVINDSYVMYDNGDNIAAILYKIQKENPIVYKRIVHVIQSIAPYFHDFYFQPSEAGKIRLQWQDKYSKMIYGPSDLSDGTVRFIALATLFMQPRLPKVIIIDEPELGLHPKAIEKLAGLIKSAAQRGTQIIAATQSAELISNFSFKDVLTVNQNNGNTEISSLNQEELEHWIDEYTLGDLWKQNIIRGGQPL